MRMAPRKPVVYRVQVYVWLAVALVSTVLTVLFVPAGTQKVIAFTVLGLAVVAALVLWRVGDYRAYVVGPPTSTQSRPWILGMTMVCCVVARSIGGHAPFLAAVAGFGVGMAVTLPVLTYVTAIPEPPYDPTERPADGPR